MKIKRSSFVFCLFSALCILAIVPEPTNAYSGCGGVTAPVVNANYEQQVLDYVNAERANNSLPPLKRSTELDNAARYHATDLGQDNYFDHTTYDRSGGNLIAGCAWSTRVASYYSGASALAENIAAGQTTPYLVMYDPTYGWMNSSGHRANILRTTVWEIGIGYFSGAGTYNHYWAQDFGKRSNVYPLIINRDASTTSGTSVSIYIYGTWQTMRLKNDNGTWGAWQPFQSSFGWTLNSTGGTRTVYAELNNGSTTVSTNDAIYLNAPIPSVPSSTMLPFIKK